MIPTDLRRLVCKALMPKTSTAAEIMFIRCILMDLALFLKQKTKKVSFRPPTSSSRPNSKLELLSVMNEVAYGLERK